MMKFARVIQGERHTGNEGRTIMVRRISESKESLSDCPMSFVEIEVYVRHIDNDVSDCRTKDFCTIRPGLHEAKNSNYPTKSGSIVYGKAPRDDGSIRLIQTIFFQSIYLCD